MTHSNETRPEAGNENAVAACTNSTGHARQSEEIWARFHSVRLKLEADGREVVPDDEG